MLFSEPMIRKTLPLFFFFTRTTCN